MMTIKNSLMLIKKSKRMLKKMMFVHIWFPNRISQNIILKLVEDWKIIKAKNMMQLPILSKNINSKTS